MANPAGPNKQLSPPVPKGLSDEARYAAHIAALNAFYEEGADPSEPVPDGEALGPHVQGEESRLETEDANQQLAAEVEREVYGS